MTKTTTITRPRKTEAAKADCNCRRVSKPSKLTKKVRLISLLNSKAGSDITSISKKFGWQPHTTRAALSGLRKAGYEISRIRPGTGKPARYRITSAPAEQRTQ